MSSPQHTIRPFEVRERAACMCDHGDTCSSFAPGHALHLIQLRLAAANPRDWADALVETVDAGTGVIVVRRLTDGAAISLWSRGGAVANVAAGAPVALHERYHVLAVGRERYNVLRG
ncbi:hypothetical protein [Microbacterium hominis]|uniref:Uncharacterized protein n=1 Tax=Microbacterium hominis TaxID=162426 RepID=A0A7D4U844_9MICO|nr:hypothetical protein [Microbacterium hominis]QKJ19686.1 hypothetical protein HQM25_10135 [Microbacterium hominis]